MGNNINVDGHVSVGRDAAVGGNATVQGNARVGGNMDVDGWLNAPNIKDCNKGVYPTEAALKARYAKPLDGWYAGVLAGTGLSAHVELYINVGGEWTDANCEFVEKTDYSVLLAGKTDKVSGATDGNLAGLDENGNLTDSGKKPADFELMSNKVTEFSEPTDAQYPSAKLVKDTLDTKAGKVASATEGHLAALNGNGDLVDSGCGIDSTPTELSSNLVRSGSVYNGLSNKANKVVHSSVSNSDKFVVLNLSGVLVYSDKTIQDLEDAMAGAESAAQSAEDALEAKNAAVDAKTAAETAQGKAEDAQTAAETAQGKAETAETNAVAAKTAAQEAALNAIGAAGKAVGEAVRVTYNLTVGEHKLCKEEGVRLMVVDGIGYDNCTYNVDEAGTVTASFVFDDPQGIPAGAFSADSIAGSVTAVHIPSFVHEIGEEAFKGCAALAMVECEGMTPPTIGNDAFDGVDDGRLTVKVHSIVSQSYTGWIGSANVQNI